MENKELLDDVLKEALEDAKAPDVSDQKLKSVSLLIERQVYLEDRLEELEQLTKEANKELERVRDSLLPDAMAAAGSGGFTTTKGWKVQLENVHYGSIKKDDEPAVFDWMAEQGHAGIIDSNVVLSLGKGNHSKAKELAEHIQAILEEPVPIKISESIHWATMRAWCKEQAQEGVELHPGIKTHAVTRAVIKRPKS